MSDQREERQAGQKGRVRERCGRQPTSVGPPLTGSILTHPPSDRPSFDVTLSRDLGSLPHSFVGSRRGRRLGRGARGRWGPTGRDGSHMLASRTEMNPQTMTQRPTSRCDHHEERL